MKKQMSKALIDSLEDRDCSTMLGYAIQFAIMVAYRRLGKKSIEKEELKELCSQVSVMYRKQMAIKYEGEFDLQTSYSGFDDDDLLDKIKNEKQN